MYQRLIVSIWLTFGAALVAFPLVISAIYYNWFGLFGGMPDLKVLENPKSELASEVYSSDGVLLGKYFRENRTPVEYEELSPNLVQALRATEDIRFDDHSGIDLRSMARVAWGVITFDPQGGGSTLSQQLARNLFQTRSGLHNGTLCKLPVVGTLIIKTKEWVLAVNIERSYTKKEIMTMYLNTVDFGSNAFGIKVAANTFFGVKPSELTIPQAAVLVGVLKAPTYYSPVLNPENAIRRRNTVFQQMYTYRFISKATFDSLKSIPLEVANYAVESHNTGMATYFRSELAKDLRKWCQTNFKANGEVYDLYTDGLRIYTTIDSRMQKFAEEAMAEHMREQQKLFFAHWKGRNPWIDEEYKEIPSYLERAVKRTDRYKALARQYGDREDSIQLVLNTPRKMKVFTWENFNNEKDTLLSPMDSVRYYKHFLHIGMVSMDPHNGHVKAWVGGVNHKYFKYDHVKQSMRQPGSTFKPIIYATAIEEKGLHPCFKIVDAPITFTLDNGDVWTPKNSEEYSGQTFTLRQAMAMSKNTAAVYLMKELAPERVAEYSENKFGLKYLRNKYGISKEVEKVYSLALGTSDVSVLEMAAAYGVFANNGVWTEPIYITRIEDKDGKVLATFVPKTIEALSEETAYVMTYMLRGSNEERGGTALSLRGKSVYKDRPGYDFIRNNELGGKTGTTSNYSDAWFVGITKNLSTAVWVGGEENVIHFRSMTYGQGARQAMPAFAYFMEKVYTDPSLPYHLEKGENGRFYRPNSSKLPEFDCWKYEQAMRNATDSTRNFVLPSRVEDDFF
jgi:penicillin-binding protein 1A